MKYEGKNNYKRDTTPAHKGQGLLPWAASLTISTNQAAQRLGCCQDTVIEMWHRGELQGWPVRVGVKGSPIRISKDSVDLYNERKLAKYDLDDPALHNRLEQRGAGLPERQNAPAAPLLRRSEPLR